MSTRQAAAVLAVVIEGCLVCHAANAGTTQRISVASDESQANSVSQNGAVVSGGGRFVAFSSQASNLVLGDTNRASDVFVRDLLTGTTERVSVSSTEGQANSDCVRQSISVDGRFVVFASEASNLVPGDTNSTTDIFVRDRLQGVTERVSTGSAGMQANGPSDYPVISTDGRFVAFKSIATNLVLADSNGVSDVFVHDRQTGETERVSVNNAESEGDLDSRDPSISGDGRYVAFHSDAANLVSGDTNGAHDIFVRDRVAGTTERVSVDSTGSQANGGSDQFPSISADGRFVAFRSFASNLVLDDTNGTADVFVRDRMAGTTERVSVASTGIQGAGASDVGSISAEGRFVSFESAAENLVAGDTNEDLDVFVRDRQASTTERVSVDTAGDQALGDSTAANISPDGRFVVFESTAWNLVPGDTNERDDIFLRDRDPGRTDLLVDFGVNGLWQRMNNSAWLKVNGLSPLRIAAGDLDGDGKDEAVATFSGIGLYARYGNAPPWMRLHAATPVRLTVGDLDGDGRDDLVGDFPSRGIWVRRNNQSAWAPLHAAASEALEVGYLDGNGKGELIADFGNAGLWVRYNNSGDWTRIHPWNPVGFAVGDLDGNNIDELIVNFGAARGLWALYRNTPWARLHSWAVQDLATGDIDANGQDDLIVDFGTAGLWTRFNDTPPWRKLHTQSPLRVITADLDGTGLDEVIVQFPSFGLQVRYNNTGPWQPLHTWPVQVIATGSFD